MPSAEFFNQFGLIAFREFLERDFCEELCRSIKNSGTQKGSFRDLSTGQEMIDELVKSRREVSEPDTGLSEEVAKRLDSLRPEIEKKYNVELEGVQEPRFCLYETGDFYGFHVDSGDYENIADYASPRKVSAIIFLNEESQVPMKGKYCGGNLTFYGLMENETFSKFGLPLIGEEGMLITFPPTLGHEVTKVTAGERYAIATWFV
jgi:predicted 2-oxoglutarate/Fe(II)-dependent dioxygenase YbiX